MVFVVAEVGDDTNVTINLEMQLVNFLMTAFPGHIFMCRATFLLIELFQPRPAEVWGDQYTRIVSRCDALYCHEGYRAHPLAMLASDLGIPILDDQLDLDLFFSEADS
jgi:hypothetical protein